MMRNPLLLLLAAALSLTACDHHRGHDRHDCDPTPTPPTAANQVLLLQVDYQTNTFEGGTELAFPTATPTFTVAPDYDPPGDFGNLRLTYQELNQPLFDGSIIWMGCGQMRFPQALTPAAQFTHTPLLNIAQPGGGFENVFNPDSITYDYAPVWNSVQGLTKVRAYLTANPTAAVKLFRYTPSVGVGDPADWNWILLLKK